MDARWRTVYACFSFCVVACILLAVTSVSGSKLLDDISLNPLKYDIIMIEDTKKTGIPVYAEDKYDKMDMQKKTKKYTCYIPKYRDVSSDGQDEDLDQKFEPYLVPLLSNCLRKWEGWWTYEFCYGKHMKQFHLDKAGNIPKDANFVLGYDPLEVGDVPLLGAHEESDADSASDADEEPEHEGHAEDEDEDGPATGLFDTGDDEMDAELKNTLERLGIKLENLEEDDEHEGAVDAADRDQDERVEQRVRVKTFKLKQGDKSGAPKAKTKRLEGKDYFALRYIKGTQCDVQDIPRESEIRFYCLPGSETSAITEIKEPATCRYTVRIDTPLICRHPKFKQILMQPEKIHCYAHSLGNVLADSEHQSEAAATKTSVERELKSDHAAVETDATQSESQHDRIRKRIQEKREQQRADDAEEKKTVIIHAENSHEEPEKKQAEMNDVRDEL